MQDIVSNEGGIVIPMFGHYVMALNEKVAHPEQVSAALDARRLPRRRALVVRLRPSGPGRAGRRGPRSARPAEARRVGGLWRLIVQRLGARGLTLFVIS